jgi:hypothetical protein
VRCRERSTTRASNLPIGTLSLLILGPEAAVPSVDRSSLHAERFQGLDYRFWNLLLPRVAEFFSRNWSAPVG